MPDSNRCPSKTNLQSIPHALNLSLDLGGYYEIRIKGHLDQSWAAWLDNLQIDHDQQGFSILTGCIVDQSALHGILAQIRDLNLILVSLTRLNPENIEG